MEPKTGDDKAHLPSPTLWPIGFAIGIVCVLVGLIVSWPAVAVGGAIVLLFGFLWVRDLSKGKSDAEPPPPPVAPGVATNVDPAGMPEPAPGERFPRNKFLEFSTLGLGAVIGGLVTIPPLGMLADRETASHIDPVSFGCRHQGAVGNARAGLGGSRPPLQRPEIVGVVHP